ncbi:MAG: hypothetical protein RL154_484 [Pseudomonadota bacterium]|jgi:hypothetical protein
MLNTLKDFVPKIEHEKLFIIQEWLCDERLMPIFDAYSINRNFFGQHFGYRILNYFIGVITGTAKLGECPAVSVMLKFFEAKNIEITDVFRICDTLKKTLVMFLINNNAKDARIYNELFYLFGENFAGVLDEIITTRYNTPISGQKFLEEMESDSCLNNNEQYELRVLSFEEKQNLSEVIEDISDYIGMLSTKQLYEADVEQFAQKIKKQAYMLITFGMLDTLSHNLLKLANTISAHKSNFITSLSDTLFMFESFSSDLKDWLVSVNNNNNAIDLEHSIIANISQICLNLSGESSEDIEFF